MTRNNLRLIAPTVAFAVAAPILALADVDPAIWVGALLMARLELIHSLIVVNQGGQP